MKIHFYAHASFRLEDESVAVVTDPYTPGPAVSNFAPIAEPADVVIMSSAVDTFHSDPSHVLGDPVIVNAVDVPPEGIEVRGVPIRAYQTMESQTFDYGKREAEPNAMYWFELGGLRCFHMGDLGNPFSETHANQLRGEVDVMFVLTGGEPTIALPDVVDAIDAVQPKVVIPMHYYSPRGRLNILPLEAFTELYPAERITQINGSDLELTPADLPQSMHICVLQQSR